MTLPREIAARLRAAADELDPPLRQVKVGDRLVLNKGAAGRVRIVVDFGHEIRLLEQRDINEYASCNIRTSLAELQGDIGPDQMYSFS
jgi:hypothetical protein